MRHALYGPHGTTAGGGGIYSFGVYLDDLVERGAVHGFIAFFAFVWVLWLVKAAVAGRPHASSYSMSASGRRTSHPSSSSIGLA